MSKPIIMFAMMIPWPVCSNAADLVVSIDNIDGNIGKVYAQAFQGIEHYQKGIPVGQIQQDAKDGPNQLIFSDLQAGEYVVRIFHDQNNNEEFDQKENGIPLEGYGFSNEAAAEFGPPSYEDMIVIIKEGDETVRTNAKMFY